MSLTSLKTLEALERQLERVKESGKKKTFKGYLIIPLERMKVKEDYIMVFQESVRSLLENVRLTNEEFRVFFYLLSITDFENWILMSQSEIGQRLGMKRPNVSRALKRLEEKGLIYSERKGRNNVYKLNPLIAWKGKEFNRQNVLKLDE